MLGRSPLCHRFHYLAVLVLVAATPLHAQRTQTLPRGFDIAEGFGETSFPFETNAPQKWHWVYDTIEFDETSPILITRIELRPNGGITSWGPATYENLEVILGASRNDYSPGTYDSVFDNNFVPGSRQAFFSGALEVPAGTSPGTSPAPWSISIPGTPYLFDPSQGNDLIVQVRTPGRGAGNPVLHATDVDGGIGSAGYGDIYDANASVASSFMGAPIINIEYVNADGLFPYFTAASTGGASPLTVQFTDRTFSSASGGVVTWAWDFDGDGTIDSTVQNPTYTFTSSCQAYDVTLSVTDTDPMHGTQTLTRTGIVRTDPLPRDFSADVTSGCVPLAVQFRTGSAATYAWDFDGDGLVDSTVQNPTFIYTRGSQVHDVSLVATTACGAWTSIRKDDYVATADRLTTLFYANTGTGLRGGAVFFDVTVTREVEIFGFETHFNAAAGTPVGMAVHLGQAGGTYSSQEEVRSFWTQVGVDDGSALAAGGGNRTQVRLQSSITLTPGVWPMALEARGTGYRTTSGAPREYGDANLMISIGSSSRVFYGPATPYRTWNGSILYCLGCRGARTRGGVGCPDTSGANLALNVSGCPDLGSQVTLTTLAPSPGALPILMVGGISDQVWAPGVPLPLDLTPLGATGCNVYVSSDILLRPSGASLTLPVPNLNALVGRTLHWQGLAFEPGVNALNTVFTDYVSLTIG